MDIKDPKEVMVLVDIQGEQVHRLIQDTKVIKEEQVEMVLQDP
tara:strand:+ start:262 stop:390 length:129 start_codon:yes stop_codon:yes gene_type:complete